MLRGAALRGRCATWIAAVAWIGCSDRPADSPAPQPAASAEDASIQAVLDAAPRGTPAVAAAINGVTDPLLQVVAVTRLADQGALLTGELCQALDQPATRRRCFRFARRPHLTQDDLSQPVREKGRPASGPPAALLAPDPAVESTLTGVPMSAQDCGERPPDECHIHYARRAAGKGRVADAAGLCAAVTEERWRWECAFEAAERAARRGGGSGHLGMVELCLRAGTFRARCLQHGVRLLALTAPDANAPAEAWAPILETAGSMETFWADRDPTFGAWQRQRLWSYATYHAYGATPHLTGAPLAALPDEAHPHVEMAAAYRLLADPTVAPDGTLTNAGRALQAALDQPPAGDPPERPGARLHPPDPRWNIDNSDAEAEIPAMFCLGSGRRAAAPDPAVDRRITLVEAAARQDPPRLDLVTAGTVDPDPLVTWTAARVARWHAPGGPGSGRVGGPATADPRDRPDEPAKPDGR